jgi:hypothetical protein
MTFEQWLASDEGKMCANYSTLTGAEYLRNRLWWAFQAGLNAEQKSSQFANRENGASTAEGKQ